MLKWIQQVSFIIVFILLISIAPMLIQWNGNHFTVQFSAVTHLFTNNHGESIFSSMTYQLGSEERKIFPDVLPYAAKSFLLLSLSVLIGVAISLCFTVFIKRFFFSKMIRYFLHILAIIPDFIIILFTLMLAIKFYQWTGIRVISLRPNEDPVNLWFPIFMLSITPTLYLFKLLSLKYRQISEEDYIRTAVAKGIPHGAINVHHIYKNIEPFLKADLIKVISMTVANLFIVEFLLNVPGLTKLLFTTNYQLLLTFFTLLLLFMMSIVIYFIIQLVLLVVRKGLVYG